MLFARRYRSLSEAMNGAGPLHERAPTKPPPRRGSRGGERARTIRIELATATRGYTGARDVHAHELEINRRPAADRLDTQQAEMLMRRAEESKPSASSSKRGASRNNSRSRAAGCGHRRSIGARRGISVASVAAEEYTQAGCDRSAGAGRREGARRRVCRPQHHHRIVRSA